MALFGRASVREIHDTFYLKYYKPPSARELSDFSNLHKIHYACGKTIMENWLNADIRPRIGFQAPDRKIYLKMSLVHPHPFPSDRFEFGFSEDFLEHLIQADSITFLSEAFRTLKKDGVLRISTPGLAQVLKKHYSAPSFQASQLGKSQAYSMWGHHHFYSGPSIEMVAKHIGFRKVEFPKYGESNHRELRGLDTRIEQADLNLIVELTK
jgi:predicted SAM-dependent methyltransferase